VTNLNWTRTDERNEVERTYVAHGQRGVYTMREYFKGGDSYVSLALNGTARGSWFLGFDEAQDYAQELEGK
jgi:hypothetical protein